MARGQAGVGGAHPVVLRVYSDHQNTGCDARPMTLAAKVACCCGADAEQMGTERRDRGATTRGGSAGRTLRCESPAVPGSACGAKAWALATSMATTITPCIRLARRLKRAPRGRATLQDGLEWRALLVKPLSPGSSI